MKVTEEMPKNKSKRIANISLAVMGAGFLATLPLEQTTSVKIIQGGFEAGLVGGLADWFAVTALFRHPLNIPIPHTALLPKNRKKITNAILNVAEKELLNKKSILEKVSNIHIANMILNKLTEQVEKDTMKDNLKEYSRILLQTIDKDKVTELTKEMIADFSGKTDTKSIMSSLIDHSLSQGYDEKIYSVVFQLIEKKISTKETKKKITEFLIETMEKKAENGFFKIALKPLISVGRDKLASIVEKAVDDLLIDLQDEQSENRKNILAYIRKEVISLKENESFIRQLNEKKDEFVQGHTFDEWIHSFVHLLFEKAGRLIEDDQFIEGNVLPALRNALHKVKNNTSFVEKTEAHIKDTLGNLIEQNHSKIGALIKENLDRLDNDQLTDMLENKIGKELSWIRVNGSLCGFLIGIGLSVLKIMTIA